MKKLAIFLNGEYSKDLDKMKEYVKDREIIAVDGGLNEVYKLNLIPKKIVGDMDSVDKNILKKYENIEKVYLEKEKDHTDFEVALLNYTPNKSGRFKKDNLQEDFSHLDDTDILVLGATGNRVDMTLSNLKKMHGIKNIRFLSHNFEIIEYTNKSKVYKGINSYTFSIIPIENIEKLSLKGFKYPLINKDISLDIGLVSNIVTGNECVVEFKKGSMYIIYREEDKS
ncbi:thiamine diphosphokinase [Oceanivirga miroungae]|uniref:Thiamine diphosphokinase n=1 Tax=Oceanivirga miroungae TaxID=1130046 RepID=A0A6I8M817_9FUSO|nr:thiamine diphosphokinase [Oceanivirga miroungae]VWL85569.1 thiamine pyrophosphokinase [Oceanivirga miroungae]